MTRKSSPTDTQDANPISAALDSMAALGPMHETALKAWFEIGAEALKFVSSRIAQDIETQKAMLGCTRLDEVQKLQAAFCTKAIEDYNAEACRMMALMVAPTAQGIAGLLPSSRRDYDDVPL